MRTRTRLALSHATLLVGLGTACSSVTPDDGPSADRFWGAIARPADTVDGGSHDLVDFLAGAEPGDATVLTSTDGRGTLQISVERDYYAASGKSCRRLVWVADDGRATSRVACRDQLGAWRLLPLLRNRALPGLELFSAPAAGPAS